MDVCPVSPCIRGNIIYVARQRSRARVQYCIFICPAVRLPLVWGCLCVSACLWVRVCVAHFNACCWAKHNQSHRYNYAGHIVDVLFFCMRMYVWLLFFPSRHLHSIIYLVYLWGVQVVSVPLGTCGGWGPYALCGGGFAPAKTYRNDVLSR